MRAAKLAKPASSVDAPFLGEDAARQMPEFVEGKKAARDGVPMTACSYAIFNLPEKLTSVAWRESYKVRRDAWMYGFNDKG